MASQAQIDANGRNAQHSTGPRTPATWGTPETWTRTLYELGPVSCGVWECTPGTFKWVFSYDETLVVVTGAASVALDTGETIELEPGVLAFFGRGHEATWTVHETLRKAFHADSPDPLPF